MGLQDQVGLDHESWLHRLIETWDLRYTPHGLIIIIDSIVKGKSPQGNTRIVMWFSLDAKGHKTSMWHFIVVRQAYEMSVIWLKETIMLFDLSARFPMLSEISTKRKC